MHVDTVTTTTHAVKDQRPPVTDGLKPMLETTAAAAAAGLEPAARHSTA